MAVSVSSDIVVNAVEVSMCNDVIEAVGKSDTDDVVRIIMSASDVVFGILSVSNDAGAAMSVNSDSSLLVIEEVVYAVVMSVTANVTVPVTKDPVVSVTDEVTVSVGEDVVVSVTVSVACGVMSVIDDVNDDSIPSIVSCVLPCVTQRQSVNRATRCIAS